DLAGQPRLALQLLLVAVLDARLVRAHHAVDLLLRQRAVGVRRALLHVDLDLVLLARAQRGPAVAVPVAAPGVELAGAVDVAHPGAAAAGAGTARREAAGAAAGDQARPLEAVDGLLDVVVGRQELAEARAARLGVAERRQEPSLGHPVAQHVLLPLGHDG